MKYTYPAWLVAPLLVAPLGAEHTLCVLDQLSEAQCRLVEPPHGVESSNPPMPTQPAPTSWTVTTGTATPHVTLASYVGGLKATLS
jgi:hypothetical protein